MIYFFESWYYAIKIKKRWNEIILMNLKFPLQGARGYEKDFTIFI
jgi:hypothetical protein